MFNDLTSTCYFFCNRCCRTVHLHTENFIWRANDLEIREIMLSLNHDLNSQLNLLVPDWLPIMSFSNLLYFDNSYKLKAVLMTAALCEIICGDSASC